MHDGGDAAPHRGDGEEVVVIEFRGDTVTIRSVADEVRGLGLDVQAGALDTAPALLRAAQALAGSRSDEAAASCADGLAATLADLSTALLALATALHRAAEEYDVAEQRQLGRFGGAASLGVPSARPGR